MKHVINLTFRNATKGTYRYQETGDGTEHVVGTLYVKKEAVEGVAPQQLTVTIEG